MRSQIRMEIFGFDFFCNECYNGIRKGGRFLKKLLIFVFIITTLFCLAVSADEDFDGYVLKFKDEEAMQKATEYFYSMPRLMSAGEGEEDSSPLSDVYAPQNIYKTYDEKLVKQFEKMGLLEYCDKDVYCELMEYAYDDPELTNQWSYSVTNSHRAWDLGLYGNNVTVAVLDSGVNMSHVDLADNLVSGGRHFYKDDDGNVLQDDDVTDSYGHGTMVAGVIGAKANGVGVVGLAHRVNIVPIKIAENQSLTTSTLVAGLEYVIDNLDVDVINISLGFYPSVTGVRTALKRAIDNNIIVVCAAGNYGNFTGNGSIPANPVMYPAGYSQMYPGIISVAALQKNLDNTYQIAAYSTHNNYVTITAPGSSIRSTSYSGGYGNMSGTSFSSPFVAAAAALVKSIDRSITPAEFRQALIATADKTLMDGELFTEYFGYGVIDVGALVEKVITDRTTYGFISPIDRKSDGSVTVRLYNPSESNITSSFIAKVQGSDGRLSKAAVKSVALSSGEYKEYDISELSDGDISCYLLEHALLRPLYKVIKG